MQHTAYTEMTSHGLTPHISRTANDSAHVGYPFFHASVGSDNHVTAFAADQRNTEGRGT
jgi:hypothetical protein